MRTVNRWHVALLASLALLASTVTGLALAQQAGGELVFAVNREADMLDLHVGSSRYDLVAAAQIYDTYLFLNEQGEYLPWLAEEVTANDDATVYTIRLRPGVTFHDGTPLDAEAVKFNFDRIVDPATQSAKAAGEMGPYNRTEVVDALTAVVHFDAPYPGFLAAISDWRSGGPHSPTAIQADPEGYRFAPVGTGPFRFVEWVQGSRIVLERNPDYAWPRPDVQHQGPALLDRVVIRTIAEGGSRVASLRGGEIDGLLQLPPQELANFENDPGFVMTRATLPGSGVILVVNAGKPPTDDLAFREALLHIIAPDQISRIGYFGAWPPHRSSVLSETNPGFVDLSDTYTFDPERAAQLLEEAGWTMGPDGVRAKDGVRAEIVYIGFPSPETTRVLELIQSIAEPIGIRIAITELESGAIHRARQAGEHHIAHLTFIYTDAHFLRTLFHSENAGGGWNFIHREDATLDGLLEAVQIEPNEAQRTELAAEIQRYMLEQVYVLPTVYQHTINVFGSHVQNVEAYPVYGEAPYFYETYKN